jgi:hypothetical protein
MFLWAKPKAQFVTGPSPIPALTCPDTPELGLLRSRPAQSIAMTMVFGPARRSVASVLRQLPGYWCNMQANSPRSPVTGEATKFCGTEAAFT